MRPVKAEQRIVRPAEVALLMAQGVCIRDAAKALGIPATHWSAALLGECYPKGEGHIICRDNLAALRDTDDPWDWLAEHARWTLHPIR